MNHAGACGLGCGRRAFEWVGIGAREPFVLPGTLPRYAPDRAVDVVQTRLEVDLDPARKEIAGRVVHRVEALATTDRLRLHADELEILDVREEAGEALAWSLDGDQLDVVLERPLAVGDGVSVSIAYRGRPRRGIYFMSPDEDDPARRPEIWTQGQDEDSRAWFPCFDHPSEKAAVEVIARVPADCTTLGNGALVERAVEPDGRVRWHWRQAIPHSAYLVSLVVGRFAVVELGTVDGVPLSAYVPEGREADAERSLGRTPDMLRLFNERFGVSYPYEKYAQAVVQDFIFGGMENTTATTLVDTVLLDERAAIDTHMEDLVAHELAHQWWGDLLTCHEWSHAWLNEGFATYSQILWEEHARGADDADYERLLMLRRYLEEDGRNHRRAIVERRYAEPIDLFDRHLYEKGALVLHMLRTHLGEEAFWRGIRAYARDHRGRTVVTEDLRRSFERATGRDVERMFEQWVFHAGHPVVEVRCRHDAEAGLLEVSIRQKQGAADDTAAAFAFDLLVVARDGEGHAIPHRIAVERVEQVAYFPCAVAPQQIDVDPRGDLLGVLEVEQDDARWRATLAGTAPLRARIRALEGLAKKPSARNVEALAAALRDDHWAMVAEAARILGDLQRADARDALLEALRGEARPKARRALVQALGAFRGDEEVGRRLLELFESGDASIHVEAAAARALGRLRHAPAREALVRALVERNSWGETIRSGCVDGLVDWGTPESVAPLLEAARRGRPLRARAAALRGLGRLGAVLERSEAIYETLVAALVAPDVRLVMSAMAGLAALGDERSGGPLGRVGPRHPDGRVQRAARVAARQIAARRDRTSPEARLVDRLSELEQAQRRLLERVERWDADSSRRTSEA